MCGLAGLFLPKSATMEIADMDAMLRVMRHRGPNGLKRYEAPDRRYQAGFARLAIIDLTTGDQPISDVSGRRVLMGNGEIYNYRELRARPEAAQYPFRTQGDMEAVFPLLEREGINFLDRLNGMYALAVFDSQEHELLLARDRLGIKPIYWAKTRGGGVIFASEIKALFASRLITPEIDEQAVSEYLAHGYVPAPQTLYRGVQKLPPGHYLRVDKAGRIEIVRYWRAEPSTDIPSDPIQIQDHLLKLLRDSVRLQLRSDVPLGALLSGGIDSGLLVALAAEQLDNPLHTYTVRFQGAAYDESPLAALVAQRYSTQHTQIELGADSLAAHLPRLAWHCDEPLADASLLPNDLIESILAKEVTVALNGTGGDELFAGYGRYFQLPVERRYLSLPYVLRRYAIEPIAKAFAPMIGWRLERAEKWEKNRGGYLHDHSTLFPPPIRGLIGHRGTSPESIQAKYFAEYKGPTETAALYADLNSYLPEDLLLLLDRTSMAHSIEGRVPFLDHRLVEAALAVPPSLRICGGRQKALEREIARAFLPEDLLNAPKRGFASPVAAWFQNGLTPLARRLLTRPASLARGWWDEQGIDRLLADTAKHGHRLYALMMLEMTVRLHVESIDTAAPVATLEDYADAA